MYIFMQAYMFFPVVIQYFLSFGYCDALKDGLARTVKVFRNGARTSLLLSTGVPSMQTWPITVRLCGVKAALHKTRIRRTLL